MLDRPAVVQGGARAGAQRDRRDARHGAGVRRGRRAAQDAVRGAVPARVAAGRHRPGPRPERGRALQETRPSRLRAARKAPAGLRVRRVGDAAGPGLPRASARPIDRLAPRQAARPQDLPDAHRLARPALALVVGRGILRGGVAARDVARRGEVLAAGLLAQGKDDVAGRRPPLRPGVAPAVSCFATRVFFCRRRPPLRPDGDAARLDPRLRGDRPPAHAHGLPRRPGGDCAAGGGRRDAQAAARRAQPPRRARVQPRLVPREPGDAGVADGKVRGGRLVRLHGLDPTRAERRAPRRRGLDLWRMPRPLPVRQQRHRAAVRHARVAVQTDVPVPVRDADRRGAAGGASRSAKS
mmetsp:Transcript_22595/g.66369  ORF Transcript_22595/g.66369 Transcript_22595/m.66369 type:complete len:353 (+) Transcript_22595:700-1758(+)